MSRLFAFRPFLLLLIGLSCGAGLAYAEQAQVPRGALVLIGLKVSGPEVGAFRQGLREAGYVEGRDVVLEYKSAEGDYLRLPIVVTEAIQTHPSVLVVETTPGERAAMEKILRS